MSRRLLPTQAASRRRATRPSFIAGAAKPSASRRVLTGQLEARPAPLLRLTANDPACAPASRGARWQNDGRAPREPSDLFIKAGRW